MKWLGTGDNRDSRDTDFYLSVASVTSCSKNVQVLPPMKRLLKEPLLHFILLGIAIFALYQLTGDRTEPHDSRIVVTSQKTEQLISGFSRTWQRAPSSEELRDLIEDYVKEEIFYREALAIGLDKDDTIVRRRMRQKFEFLNADTTALTPPRDQDLQAWLEKNPDKFRVEPKVALRQIYVNASRRGTGASAEAMKLLAQLNSEGKKLNPSMLGDASLLPHDLALSTLAEIARVFGGLFAEQVGKLEPGRWAGPVQSGYGLHLVYVSERTEGRSSPLAEVRELVEREWFSARREEAVEARYRTLREKYAVVVQPVEPRSGASFSQGSAANAAPIRQ